MIDTAVILKRFEEPDEVRTFDKGRFEIVRIGGMSIGRATYEPGWKWSEHVGPSAGQTHCCVEHLGLVVSGHATAEMQTGVVHHLTAGTLFYIPAEPHDSFGLWATSLTYRSISSAPTNTQDDESHPNYDFSSACLNLN